MFYIAVLSLDIRRMELSDIEEHRQHHRRVFRLGDDDVDADDASAKESVRTQFEALESALKDSSKQTTILLNSGFVLLSMVNQLHTRCCI